DCFLNAALQYMRRAKDLVHSLNTRVAPEELNEEAKKKEFILKLLTCYMTMEGTTESWCLRTYLPFVLTGLEQDFLYTQQDAYEILIKIFDQLIPPSIEKTFHIEAATRRRCRDRKDCNVS
ncbi:hypothetical protein PMAYCL1PPCAC_24691, partial [Pristionchus mayeri]